MKKDLAKLLAKLDALKKNLPQDRFISERYAEELNAVLDDFKNESMQNLDDFKVPDSEVKLTPKDGLYSGGYCDRNYISMKVDGILEYYKLTSLYFGNNKLINLFTRMIKFFTLHLLILIVIFAAIFLSLQLIDKKEIPVLLFSIITIIIPAFIALLAFLLLIKKDGLQDTRDFMRNYLDIQKDQCDAYKISSYAKIFGLENVIDCEKIEEITKPGCSDAEIYRLQKACKRLKDINNTFKVFVFETMILIFLSFIILIINKLNPLMFPPRISLSVIASLFFSVLICAMRLIQKIYFSKYNKQQDI